MTPEELKSQVQNILRSNLTAGEKVNAVKKLTAEAKESKKKAELEEKNAQKEAKELEKETKSDARVNKVEIKNEKADIAAQFWTMLRGDQGEQGVQGEIGPQGEQGPQGADSDVPGPVGPAGSQGESGVAGPRGPEGPMGLEGLPGEPGKDGKDGSSDTAEDIRNKLESLKEDKQLKGIKDLKWALGVLDQRTQFLINKQGGTGSGTATSPLTTKGDIWGYGTADDRVPVGADGLVLTADSTQALGVKWAAVAGTGDVVKVGTPADNQIGVWTGDGTIEGDADFTWDGNTLLAQNDTDGASVQLAIFEGDRATMAANDEAYLTFRLSDAAGTQTEFARITWVATDVTDASEDGRLDFSVMTAGSLAKEMRLDGAILAPSTSDGLALGNGSLMWADLFLASGAVINWNNGDVSLTHASNTLTFSGATTGYLFTNGRVGPSSNDGVALGSATVSWSDLFLASGGVINWNNGNATLTHSVGLLTSNVDIVVPDEVYGIGWDASLEVPTKNALYDIIQTKVSLPGTPEDYTVTNGTTDRTYDANVTSVDELADVLATLIADLTATGILQ